MQLGRYVVVSATSFFSKLALYYLFEKIFRFSETASYAVTLIILLITNFTLLRKWVFPDSSKPIVTNFTAFLVISLVSRGTEVLAFHFLTIYEILPTLFRILAVSVFFLVVKYFIFQRMMYGRDGMKSTYNSKP